LWCKSPHTNTHIHYGNDLKLFFAWANKPPAAIFLAVDPNVFLAGLI
jgi:hypothetical protein